MLTNVTFAKERFEAEYKSKNIDWFTFNKKLMIVLLFNLQTGIIIKSALSFA